MDLKTLQWHLSCAPTGPLRARDGSDYPDWNHWLDMYTSNCDEDAASLTGRMPDDVSICFAVTVDDRINGQAFISTAVDGGKYRFATVTAGAILSIHQLCFYAMSRKDVLPSVGNVELEAGETVNIPFDLRTQYLVSVLSHSKTKPKYPRCPDRRTFAFKMAYGAISFLIHHEFAHCVNGHIWPSEAPLQERFAEASQLSNPEQTRRMHAKEFQADLVAARSVFGLIYNDFIGRDLHCWRKELTTFELPASLYPIVTGICLLFRILGSPANIPTRQEEFYRGSHPHPIIRSRVIGTHISGFVHGRRLESPDGWIWATAIGLTSASEIWETLTGQKEATVTYTLDQGTDHKSGIDRVMAYYLECRSTEEPYLRELRSRIGAGIDPYRPPGIPS